MVDQDANANIFFQVAQMIRAHFFDVEKAETCANYLNNYAEMFERGLLADESLQVKIINDALKGVLRDRHTSFAPMDRFVSSFNSFRGNSKEFKEQLSAYPEMSTKVGYLKQSREIIFARKLTKTIGYIHIDSFIQQPLLLAEELCQKLAALGALRTLVIDVRENSGGYAEAAAMCAAIFLNSKQTLTVETSQARAPGSSDYITTTIAIDPDLGVTVSHVDKDGEEEMTVIGKPVYRLPNNTKVAVWVTSDTASAAEVFTAALQDCGRAVVIGTPTTGKGVGQEWIRIGQHMLRVTSMRWNTASGHNLREEAPIQPDIELVTARLYGAILGGDSNNHVIMALRRKIFAHFFRKKGKKTTTLDVAA